MRTFVLIALLSSALAACQSNQLAPAQLVAGPRVLGMVAEPPEVMPGATSRLSAVYADPTSPPHAVTFEWSACVSPDAIGAGGFTGAQYGVEQHGPGCPPPGIGTPPTVALTTGADGSATLPASFTTGILTDLATLAVQLGSSVTPAALTLIAATTGIPVLVQVTVRDTTTGAELVTAFKRVLVSYRDPGGTNPPAPRFAINGSWVTARASGLAPFTCVPEDPAHAPTAMLGEKIALSPDPDDASWQESYTVLAPDGSGFLTKTEGSYYAWFSTIGDFQEGGATQAPTRDEAWTSPLILPAGAGADVPIWVVVRDGHGGTSGCVATVHLL